MLEKSDTNLGQALAAFNSYGAEVALIVPTQTGLQKSIMDATQIVRDFLRDSNFHDYATQGQGPDQKVTGQAFLVRPDGLESSTVSLYRPQTKNGDPRIWFSGLSRYADPWNLLALIIRDGAIYVINCSNHDVMATMSRVDAPLGALVDAGKDRGLDPVVGELIERLRAIAGRGFMPTLRVGDTGVGMTLETALGIAANSNKAPDYKGIELKAKRITRGIGNRATLFSQVPNWGLSPIGSAWNLLSKYGYHRNGKLRLNHEIRSNSPNSLGFLLAVDGASDWLRQNHFDKDTKKTEHVVTWEMDTLRQRLVEKHPQTFWISAACRGAGDQEEFHYTTIEHTKQPSARNFEALLEGGLISVDYLMSEKSPNRVRDHGYLFKIHPSDFGALFPPSSHYDLLA
jgi:hypothetical protein